MLSIDSWNETFNRWIREGMPVKKLENKQEVNMHLIGEDEQNEGIIPKVAIGGMGKNNNPPYSHRFLNSCGATKRAQAAV